MLNFIRGRNRWYWIAGTGLVCAAAAFLIFQSLTVWTPAAKSFDGPSTSLRQTVVAPTLDAPIPEGKSAVWCASFQLAWDRLKKDVAKGPLEVQNAEAVAARLNAAEYPESSLDPTTFFAAAGLTKNGIVERIKAEMEKRFPETPTPELDPTLDGAVAYGYLKAGVKYSLPFFDNDKAFTFTDSAGISTRVKSFGVRRKDEDAYNQLRKQVAILYLPEVLIEKEEITEFILDPCRDSSPYQILLARVDRKATLAATLADAERKIKEHPTNEFTSRFQGTTLLIPGMQWRVRHHFEELEGKDKQLLNPSLKGLYLDTALQTIDFRLDRGGAELASEAKGVGKKGGRSFFECNRPFLVYMKKRGGSQPFLVMWVANAELMQPW
jgi:hypothetical protein